MCFNFDKTHPVDPLLFCYPIYTSFWYLQLCQSSCVFCTYFEVYGKLFFWFFPSSFKSKITSLSSRTFTFLLYLLRGHGVHLSTFGLEIGERQILHHLSFPEYEALSKDNDKGQKTAILLGWSLFLVFTYFLFWGSCSSPQVNHLSQSTCNNSSLMFLSRSAYLLIFNFQIS